MRSHLTLSLALAGASALVLAGCSEASGGASSSPTGGDPVEIAAAFYPLQYVAERVGGDLAVVTPLAPPGVEPHDLELSPSAVRDLNGSDLVLYIHEFQPAVDAAVENSDVRSLDAATVIELHAADHDHDHDSEAGDDDHADDGHDHGATDPHFWLDPTLLATYAESVATELASIDPENAATYASNASLLAADLLTMDESYTSGLQQCERDTIIVSHEAYGYLGDRYGIQQEGIAGIDPEAEPSPARLLEIRDIVDASGATTIYTESLLSTAVADAVAQDTGATTAVLDPIETAVGDDDYPTIMARNLEALRTGLGCA